jgi:two-component system OmpR family sensor kinase
MADEAKILSSKGPGSRLAVPEDAEFGPLAERLNEFLDKIQASVRSQERFVADAAHELRTPLTILRGQVETTLLRERTGPEYAKVLNLLLDEAVRMSELVESLLVSSQASMTSAEVRDITVDVQEAVDRWTPRFREQQVALRSEIHPAEAPVLLRELDSVLDNLLGNALRHSTAGSSCWVVLSDGNGKTEISVADEGPGIPDEFKGQVFERFYRTDTSRNRDSGGFGIGLAICKRIANERGATIQVLDNSPTGAKFVVTWLGLKANA